MTKARREQIDLSLTPWYHCISRCVRQAWLCGIDPVTGRDYSHRKGWIEQRIRQLAEVFAIDIAAYAVMDNHYHIVLRVDRDKAESWNQQEVLTRWAKLFSLPKYILDVQKRLKHGEDVPDALCQTVDEAIETYRKRLYDISWFMRILNESIARMANKEDRVKGRFWQGRYKSQAILDEAALVAVMAYVDMNPLRAGIVEHVEQSQHTSLKARLEGRAGHQPAQDLPHRLPPHQQSQKPAECNLLKDTAQASLLPFADQHRDSPIPIRFTDYLELVDYLSRAIHPHKRGHTLETEAHIFDRLGLKADIVEELHHWSERFGSEIGRASFHRKGARLNRRLFAVAA